MHEVLARSVHYSLKYHCETFNLTDWSEIQKELSDVHLIFYEWFENENDFGKEKVIDAFNKWVESGRKTRQEKLDKRLARETIVAGKSSLTFLLLVTSFVVLSRFS